MRCPKCGEENKDGALFCQSCKELIAAAMPVIGEEYLDEVVLESPSERLEPMEDKETTEYWHSVKWINTNKEEEKAAIPEKHSMMEDSIESIPVGVLAEDSFEAMPEDMLAEEFLEAIPEGVLAEESLEAIPVAELDKESYEAIPEYAIERENTEKASGNESDGKKSEAVPMAAIDVATLHPDPIRERGNRWDTPKKPVKQRQRPEPEPGKRPQRDGNTNTYRVPHQDAGKRKRNNYDNFRDEQGRNDTYKNNPKYEDVTSRTKGDSGKFTFRQVQLTEEKKKTPKHVPAPRFEISRIVPWAIALACLVLLLIVLLVRCDGTSPGETTGPVENGGASLHTTAGTETKEPTETQVQTEPQTEPSVPETKEPVYETVYRVIAADISWEQAKRECEAWGGTLATITSAEEYEAVCAEANKSGLTCLWLGAHLEGSNWADQTWVTGEKMTFTKWFKGEPSYIDSSDNVEEYYLCMWNIGDDATNWTFNDQRNDPVKDYPKQFSGKLGYVLELKVEVTQ